MNSKPAITRWTRFGKRRRGADERRGKAVVETFLLDLYEQIVLHDLLLWFIMSIRCTLLFCGINAPEKLGKSCSRALHVQIVDDKVSHFRVKEDSQRSREKFPRVA